MSELDHRLIDMVLHNLDGESRYQLVQSLNHFFYSLDSQRISYSQTEKTISQVSNYLKKKSDELHFENFEENPIYSLRKLRNEMAHGRPMRDFNLQIYYPKIWKAISKLGDLYGPVDMENLISYTLHVPNRGLAHAGYSPSKISSAYRRMFDSLNSDEKRMVFSELLLRLFSDPEAMIFLEDSLRK